MTYHILVGAFESFILIEQANGNIQTTFNKLSLLDNAITKSMGDERKVSNFLPHLLNLTAMTLNAGEVEHCKECHI